MNAESEHNPDANQPRPNSARGRQVVLAVAWIVVVGGLSIVAGAWIGHAITGKSSGGLVGGGIVFVVVAAVFQRIVLRQGVLDISSAAFGFVVCIALLYYACRLAEQRIEAASQYAAITAADRSQEHELWVYINYTKVRIW